MEDDSLRNDFLDEDESYSPKPNGGATLALERSSSILLSQIARQPLLWTCRRFVKGLVKPQRRAACGPPSPRQPQR
jgi:hypothetical protein